MALDFGRLLDELREEPYDEVCYCWKRQEQAHILSARMNGETGSIGLTDSCARRLEGEVAEKAMREMNEQLWDQLTDEARR